MQDDSLQHGHLSATSLCYHHDCKFFYFFSNLQSPYFQHRMPLPILHSHETRQRPTATRWEATQHLLFRSRLPTHLALQRCVLVLSLRSRSAPPVSSPSPPRDLSSASVRRPLFFLAQLTNVLGPLGSKHRTKCCLGTMCPFLATALTPSRLQRSPNRQRAAFLVPLLPSHPHP